MSIRNVIFIDSGISDPAPLISSIPADSLWFVLEDNRDGLQQMADKLAGLTGLSSIQIVSHGAAGLLYLGAGTLGLGNLPPATPLLTRIGASLASGGDLLIYGCDVAQGSEGQKFVEQLAALTGANVAASADLSGPAGLGGNSVLEVTTGSIEAPTLDLSSLASTLGATTNSGPTGSVTISGTPTQGQLLTLNNTLADANGLGTFSYQWQADGVDISGATGSSLTLRQTQVGKAITVRVSYTADDSAWFVLRSKR